MDWLFSTVCWRCESKLIHRVECEQHKDVQQEQCRELSPFKAKYSVSESNRKGWAKRGARHLVEVMRAAKLASPSFSLAVERRSYVLM